MIASALLLWTGATWPISLYLIVVAVVTLSANSSCPRNIAPAPRLSDTLMGRADLRDLTIDAGLAIKTLLTYSGRSQPAHSGVDRAEFPVRRNKTE